MMCDGTADEDLVAGDDWVWDYSTTSDVSGWSEPVVTITDTAGTVLFTSQGDEPTVHLNGGFGGAVPATDFATGRFTFLVERADTQELPATVVIPTVDVLVEGKATTFTFPERLVRKDRAVRVEAGS